MSEPTPPSDKELSLLQLLSTAKPILSNEITTTVDTNTGIARVAFGYGEVVKFQGQPRYIIQYGDSYILTEQVVRELRDVCDQIIDQFDAAKESVPLAQITETQIPED